MQQDWMIFEAQTVSDAIKIATKEFSVSEQDLTYEVITEGRRSLFGKVKEKAQIRAKVSSNKKGRRGITVPVENKIEMAKDYLGKLLDGLGVTNWTIEDRMEDDKLILDIDGEHINRFIGHRGETIDAIQYLVSLVANHGSNEYLRCVLNSGDFRKKREQTLKHVAEKMAMKVIKNGRSYMLEPMNPYERRIVHSAVAQIPEVTSESRGEEPHRRVIIFKEGQDPRRDFSKKKKNNRQHGGRKEEGHHSNQPTTYNFEKDFLKNSQNTKIYSKIEVEPKDTDK